MCCCWNEPNGSKRGIDQAVAALVDALQKMSKPCTDQNAIEQVGTISQLRQGYRLYYC